ncbi:MAG: methyltransferase domain-containing protein [Caldilineaceae bacterium]|nr:methyltransferase domain-containing protein [Caldilineaceae bacterium]
MHDVWNRISAVYQERQQIDVDSVRYGPFAPSEEVLGLLGSVTGKRVLDFGCGGGQAVIALAQQGASVTGVDYSASQLAFARSLSEELNVEATFIEGTASDLEQLPAVAWDLILSIYVMQYVEEPDRCLRALCRALDPSGRLIVSFDHPLRTCFLEPDEDEISPFPVRSYFDSGSQQWSFADTGDYLRSYHRTIQEWVDLFGWAGLRLRQILEPPTPRELLDRHWPEDGAHSPLRHIPQTIIFVASPLTPST